MRSSILFILIILMAGFGTTEIYAQRQYQFEELNRRDFIPPAFMSVFPGVSDREGNANASAVFRIRNDKLNFRSVPASQRQHDDERFASNVRINFEVYREEDGERTGSPMQRERWEKRTTTTQYDHTQSKTRSVEASQSFQLDPGTYVLRALVYSNDREKGSFTRKLEIKEDPEEYNWVILASPDENQNGKRLVNLGNNSRFGEGVTAWAALPDESSSYHIELDRMRVRNNDTTRVERIMDEPLNSDNIYSRKQPAITTENNAVFMNLKADSDQTLARIHIPKDSLSNNHFRLRIYDEGDDEDKITDYTWYNLWVDMPASLLNVDFAINKLGYLVDNSKLSELRGGNREERERNFLKFWTEKDSTAKTSDSSLMAEYYSRVDEAYDRFTTPQTKGYESDQGKVFITMGEPEEINREFPSSGPTREIWEYEEETYIFEATSGFGDYVLVDTR